MKMLNVQKRYQISLFLSLIPLILFTIYKNGIIPYIKGYTNLLGCLKPFILIMMPICGVIFAKILLVFKEKKSVIDLSIFSVEDILQALIFSLALQVQSSPILIFFLSFIFELLLNKLKINKIACLLIVALIINELLNLGDFHNIYESCVQLNYNFFDMLIGYNVGGLGTTNILLTILALIFLSFNKLYKKNIAYSSLITYALLIVATNIISNDYNRMIYLLCNINIVYSFIFIATDIKSSCYTEKGQTLSGIILGVMTFVTSFSDSTILPVIPILLVSMFKNQVDRIFIIK